MKFRVGDLVLGQNYMHQPEFNGMEAVVLAVLNDHPTRGAVTGKFERLPVGYRVKWAIGKVTVQAPYELRLRRPKSWDDWLYSGLDEPLVSEKEHV